MRISIVGAEDSRISVGVRKVSSFIKRLNPDTTTYYIPLTNFPSFESILRAGYADPLDTWDPGSTDGRTHRSVGPSQIL